jgi:thioredoxin reductase (NADPH)
MEEATFLTRFAKKVYIIHRRDTFRASKIMVDKALKNPKIEVLWNTVVEEVVGDKFVTGAKITNSATGEKKLLPIQGFFLAIGHEPNTKVLSGQLKTDATGYLITKSHSARTEIEGVFACGDVQDHHYRQAITAAGSGCMAAIDAERWLEANPS